jgi:hypothetical protein
MSMAGQAISHDQWSGIRCQTQQCYVSGYQPKQTTLPLALIDRGANGGVTGSDTWLIDKSLCSVHIQGIDDHMIKDVPIGTVGAVVNTQHGKVIAIMHQYAYTGKGGTIHSSSQLEWCANDVNDHSIKIDSGRQQLTSPDGYVIFIDVRHGLPYITMCPFTDEEFKELPHVLWTSEDNWDPTSLDSVISDDSNWYEAEPLPPLPNPMPESDILPRIACAIRLCNFCHCWFVQFGLNLDSH